MAGSEISISSSSALQSFPSLSGLGSCCACFGAAITALLPLLTALPAQKPCQPQDRVQHLGHGSGGVCRQCQPKNELCPAGRLPLETDGAETAQLGEVR